jgi:hypothetical protein
MLPSSLSDGCQTTDKRLTAASSQARPDYWNAPRSPHVHAEILTGFWALGISHQLPLFGGSAPCLRVPDGNLDTARTDAEDHLTILARSLAELRLKEIEQVF